MKIRNLTFDASSTNQFHVDARKWTSKAQRRPLLTHNEHRGQSRTKKTAIPKDHRSVQREERKTQATLFVRRRVAPRSNRPRPNGDSRAATGRRVMHQAFILQMRLELLA